MGFSEANTELWNPVVQIGILSVIMILANLLQRKVGFVRKSLLPTAVLGGFLALFLRASGVVPMNAAFMENITYHTIAIGFIALGLRIPKRSEIAAGKHDGLKSGALIVSTYLLQGLIGLIVTASLAYTSMPGLFKAAGILLPMGYGQGPGQANNIGTTYELAFGFSGGASFGLAIATMGFLWACVGGVIYMNILVGKKRLSLARGAGEGSAPVVSQFQDEGELPMSESVDRLTVQSVLVLSIYLLTYLFSLGLTRTVSGIAALGDAANTLNSLIWGFNFVIGSLFALIARNLFFVLKTKKLMTRQYPNNYLLNRISGFTFDLMIISSICSIEIGDLKGLWVPFSLICTLGGFATLFYLKWACRRLYPGYYSEGFFSMYGMLTGTVSTGIILLREIDPHFASPATNNLISGTGFAILFGIPMLVLVGIAPKNDAMLFLSIGLIVVYALVLIALMMRGSRPQEKTTEKKGVQ